MSLLPKKGIRDKLLSPWNPESDREAGSGIVANFLLHWFPNRISLKSFAFGYSFYLGTISFVLFMMTTRLSVSSSQTMAKGCQRKPFMRRCDSVPPTRPLENSLGSTALA